MEVYSPKRKLWGALALLGVVGSIYGVSRVGQPANQSSAITNPPRIQSETQQNSIDVLIAQFQGLSSQVKGAAFDEACSAVDSQTGMGIIYHTVISEANARTISLENLSTHRDGVSRKVYDAICAAGLDQSAHALYAAEIDTIVMMPVHLDRSIENLVRFRVTPRGVLAHESLHRIQNESNVVRAVKLVYQQGCVNAIGGKEESDVTLDQRTVNELSSLLGWPQQDAATRTLGALTTFDQLNALYEIGARCLVPKARTTQRGTIVVTIPSTLMTAHSYRFTSGHIQQAFPLLLQLYGHASSQDTGRADVVVNRLVGRHGDSFPMLAAHIRTLTGGRDFSMEGMRYLSDRSTRLNNVPAIVEQVIARYR